MHHAPLLCRALACSLLVAACGDDPRPIDLPEEQRGGVVRGASAAQSARADCDGARTGKPCGPSMHCVFDACVRNACGDGWPAYGEDCDDGNERDGDGCSARCAMELPPGCGNGVLEPGEDCDDGNEQPTDGCEPDCTIITEPTGGRGGSAGAGSGGRGGSAGTPPPDGGAGQSGSGGSAGSDAGSGGGVGPSGSGGEGGSAGSSGSGGGSGSAGSAGSSGTGGTGGTSGTSGMGGSAGSSGSGGDGGGESCTMCRELRCKSYQDVDWVAGCFEPGALGDSARAVVIAQVFTPAQVQSCVDAVQCATLSGCGNDALNPINPCYCGNITVDECSKPAVAATGPCKQEWEAMAGTTDRGNVMLSISNIELPSGWAYFLLECDRLRCNDGADGDCTP